MAWTGLTEEQRARVEDACWSLLNNLTAELAEDADTVDDAHLRAIEVQTLLIGHLDGDRVDRVVELRRPTRLGGPVSWLRIGLAAGLGRGGPEGRWRETVAERCAASAAPSYYSPAAAA